MTLRVSEAQLRRAAPPGQEVTVMLALFATLPPLPRPRRASLLARLARRFRRLG
ncbi:hypothetical protein [Elioraea sp.]|jgi:hypothetical protein|uniref:hypothetical protein n=1 Tax=Elioraea sp. TaxID=2185103 RepID=UPI003F7194D6